MLLKGEVLDNEGWPIENAVVEIKNLQSNKIKKIEVNRIDGSYVGLINLDKQDDVLVTVKAKEYAFNSQYIGAHDRGFESPTKLNFDLSKIEVGKAFKINNIYFASDSYSLSDQAKSILTSFADFLKENVKVKIAIHGHTDSDGDQKLNLELSSKRAKQVQDYIISMGVEPNRLSFKGYGEKNPLQSNNNEKGKSINRRTEFFVVEK